MIEFTEQMREFIAVAPADRAFPVVATAGGDGMPDIAMKASLMIFDDDHLAFWERSLGQTLTNLEENPKVCVQYYSGERRMLWKFFGEATLYRDGDMRQQVMDRTIQFELDRDPERKGVAVVIRVDLIKQGPMTLQERD